MESDAARAPNRLPEKTLIRVQAVTGLIFASFLVLHLTGSLLALAGQQVFDGAMDAFRTYYQFPVVEIAVIGAALAHMWAGIVRALRRRRAAKQRGAPTAPSLRMRLHRISGYYLLLAFAGHVAATRGPGLFLGMPADMSFLTYSLSYYGWFFYPYYIGLFAGGAFHLVSGMLLALRIVKVRVPAALMARDSRAFWATAGILAVGGALAVLAMGGNFFEIDTSRFAKFDAMYEQLVGFAPGK